MLTIFLLGAFNHLTLGVLLLGLHIVYISKIAVADVYLEERSSLDGVVSGTTMVQDLVELCP